MILLERTKQKVKKIIALLIPFLFIYFLYKYRILYLLKHSGKPVDIIIVEEHHEGKIIRERFDSI